jgi:diguanylate cyclase (GGDEF)-like protein
MKEEAGFLDKITILKGCSRDERKKVKSFFTLIKFKKGDIVFRQGDKARFLFIVKKGLVGSVAHLDDGNEMDMGRYSPGMFFGEMALTEGLPRTMTCTALSDVELLVINFIDFYRLIWTYPRIGAKILKAMTRHLIISLRDADKFLTNMAMWGEKARFRAITDELTGLYNKRFFEESLERAIIKSKQEKGTFSVIMFDVDNFHSINEKLGVQVGDEILKNVASCIKSVCNEKTVISRLGGDEFAVLFPDLSVTGSLQVAKNFKEALSRKRIRSGLTGKTLDILITASIGIAEYPDHGNTAFVLKEAADKALYVSKNTGKNKIMCARNKYQMK